MLFLYLNSAILTFDVCFHYFLSLLLIYEHLIMKLYSINGFPKYLSMFFISNRLFQIIMIQLLNSGKLVIATFILKNLFFKFSNNVFMVFFFFFHSSTGSHPKLSMGFSCHVPNTTFKHTVF